MRENNLSFFCSDLYRSTVYLPLHLQSHIEVAGAFCVSKPHSAFGGIDAVTSNKTKKLTFVIEI